MLVMRVTFVRTIGNRDRVYVRFPDGREKSWPFPSYGENLPHDLVHLIVERAFAISDGVWGHVARGGELGKTEPLYVAEIFANAPWLRPDEGDPLEHIARELAQRGHEPPPALTRERVDLVRAELERATADWRALADRGGLTFDYP
jgi:hypothetical protein